MWRLGDLDAWITRGRRLEIVKEDSRQVRAETAAGPVTQDEQLAEHVAAMLERYGDVSQARIQRDLHIGPDKARQALHLTRGGHLPLRAVR